MQISALLLTNSTAYPEIHKDNSPSTNKKSPAFHKTKRVITLLTKVHCWTLFWTTSSQL